MTNLHMPVIEPPTPLPANIVFYYGDIALQTAVTATPAGAHDAVTIEISNPAHGKLYAMTSGYVSFIPAGTLLHPLSAVPASKPTLLFEVDIVDMNAIRGHPAVPLVKYILYEGVDPASVRASPELLALVKKLSQEHLETHWPNPSTEPGLDALANNYLDKFLQSAVKLAVLPGTYLGLAQPAAPATSGPLAFTLRMAGPQKHDVSPVALLQAMPDIGADGLKRYDQHPLALAVAGISMPINIYLRFEVCRLSDNTYQRLPGGVRVKMLDHTNREIQAADIDAFGNVRFRFDTLGAIAGAPADRNFFFVVETAGRSHAGHTLPATWSTRGWQSTTGKPGYYQQYRGEPIGREEDPQVYRLGVDVHVQLEYLHEPRQEIFPAIQGIPIAVRAGPLRAIKLSRSTDLTGRVHGVIFDIQPGEELSFDVLFEAQDTSINMQAVRVMRDGTSPLSWDSKIVDADQTPESYYPRLDRTSIGTPEAPAKLRCTLANRNVALFFLKTVRECSIFLSYMTQGQWPGVHSLKMWPTTGAGSYSYAYPQEIRIHQAERWKRDVLFRMLGYQVLYQVVQPSQAYLNLYRRFSYTPPLFSSPETAFFEGWPEFFAVIFELWQMPPYTVQMTTAGPLLTNPLNGRGESVEGAFANGLWYIFQKFVAPMAEPAPRVNESSDGDVSKHWQSTWITNPIAQGAFIRLLWEPLVDMAQQANPSTTLMISKIRDRNLAAWTQVQAELRAFNLAP